MNDNRQNKHIVDILFVIALMFMFAFSVLILIALGASVYRRNVEVMSQNYDSRISYAYITEKMRQSDNSGGISTGDISGIPAIIITESRENGPDTVTYLYVYGGSLRELMTVPDAGVLNPEAGQIITDLQDMEIETPAEDLLLLELVHADGKRIPLYISIKSESPEEDL